MAMPAKARTLNKNRYSMVGSHEIVEPSPQGAQVKLISSGPNYLKTAAPKAPARRSSRHSPSLGRDSKLGK